MNQALKVTTFQNRFASLFDESEKTTVDLAKELHVSNQTISAWKNGTRSPKEPTIIAIANHFGVTVQWLMGFNVEKKAPETESDRRMPIIIPNTEMFMKITNYMSREDYDIVMDIFNRTIEKMKEKGLIDI